MYEWAKENKDLLTAIGCTGAGVAVAAFIVPSAVVKVGSLVIAGTGLCLGFWIGKKVTNQLDIFICKHNKKLLAELEAELK